MTSTIHSIISPHEIKKLRRQNPKQAELIYVKDWINKGNSWLLKLSNGKLQLHHNDEQVIFAGGKELLTENTEYGGCDESVVKLIQTAQEMLVDMKNID